MVECLPNVWKDPGSISSTAEDGRTEITKSEGRNPIKKKRKKTGSFFEQQD